MPLPNQPVSNHSICVYTIERTPEMYTLLSGQLQLPDVYLKTFTTARQAISEYDKRWDSNVVLILLDLDGEEGGGVWALQQLKSICYVPCIFVFSSMPELSDALAAMKAGASDYMAKPINPVSFVAHIRQFLIHYDPADNLDRYNLMVQMIERHQSLEEYLLRKYISDEPVVCGEFNSLMSYDESTSLPEGASPIRLPEPVRSSSHFFKDRMVLLVDDEPDVRTLFSLVFSDYFKIETAESADAALKLLEADTEHRIEVVVLDIYMPGLRGDYAVELIRKTRPDVEIVMLTAFPEVDKATRSLGTGAMDYVNKPYDSEALRLVIERAFEMKDKRLKYSLLNAEGGRLPFERRLWLFKELILYRKASHRPVRIADVIRFFSECEFLRTRQEEEVPYPDLMADTRGVIERLIQDSRTVETRVMDDFRAYFHAEDYGEEAVGEKAE